MSDQLWKLAQIMQRRADAPPCWWGWEREPTGLYPYPDDAREMKRQSTGAKPGRQAPSGEQTQKETGNE